MRSAPLWDGLSACYAGRFVFCRLDGTEVRWFGILGFDVRMVPTVVRAPTPPPCPGHTLWVAPLLASIARLVGMVFTALPPEVTCRTLAPTTPRPRWWPSLVTWCVLDLASRLTPGVSRRSGSRSARRGKIAFDLALIKLLHQARRADLRRE